jgi:hypothetical protein
LAFGNGVLYVCSGYRIFMYDQSGNRIGNGGRCTGEPEIVNGTLYATTGSLSASTLTGDPPGVRFFPRPDPRQLKADPRLLHSR